MQTDMEHILPLSDDGGDIYSKIGDGILLCRVINLAVPDTIDERVVNKGPKMSVFKKHENLTVAITSAQVCARHIYQYGCMIFLPGLCSGALLLPISTFHILPLGHRMHRGEHGLAFHDGGHGAFGPRSPVADHLRKSFMQYHEIIFLKQIECPHLSAIPLPQHKPGACPGAGGTVARRRDHRRPPQNVAGGNPPQMGQLST